MKTNWTELETTDPAAFRAKIDQFIDLRAKGISLRKIAEEIDVPKSTLCDWENRHRMLVNSNRRVELEALEERFFGSHEQQVSHLAKTLKLLEDALDERLHEYKYELSTTELFWMAANLRDRIQRVGRRATPHNPHETTPD